jgi:2,3,4,5-tetrahydropyridine-2-carboxylate N-succinyltransferase
MRLFMPDLPPDEPLRLIPLVNGFNLASYGCVCDREYRAWCQLAEFVDEGTMVDGWATVGSCAQIGKNVHISGGAGIGGVLEPLQAAPTIIEDGCFIGARSEVAEGVIVGEGAVLSMGVFLGASTKIVDRATGEIHMGKVPPYSVLVPGSLPGPNGGPGLYCAVIVKRVDAQTRSKTSINELLRD